MELNRASIAQRLPEEFAQAGETRRGWRQQSRRLIQRRRLAWLTQKMEILPIKGAERGFDRGAEARYTVPKICAE